MRTFGFSSTPKTYNKPVIWAYPAPGYFPLLKKEYFYPEVPLRWNVGSATQSIPSDTQMSYIKCDDRDVLNRSTIIYETGSSFPILTVSKLVHS